MSDEGRLMIDDIGYNEVFLAFNTLHRRRFDDFLF
jgi:hypothetical protein